LAIGALHVRRQTVIHVTKMLNLRNLARILGVSIPERLFSFGDFDQVDKDILRSRPEPITEAIGRRIVKALPLYDRAADV
jgi:hypothetical protein